MGLHAHIQQTRGEVQIALTGSFHASEMHQLQAMLLHFKSRGTRSLVLDVSGVTPMNQRAAASFHRLIRRQSGTLQTTLAAPTPCMRGFLAACPQTGCEAMPLQKLNIAL